MGGSAAPLVWEWVDPQCKRHFTFTVTHVALTNCQIDAVSELVILYHGKFPDCACAMIVLKIETHD